MTTDLDPIERATRESQIPESLREAGVPEDLVALILDQRDRQSALISCLSAVFDRLGSCLRDPAASDNRRVAAALKVLERTDEAFIRYTETLDPDSFATV